MKFFVYWVFEVDNPHRGYVGGAYGTGDVRPNQHIKGTCGCAPGCTTLNRPLAWEFLAHCETWEETRRMEMACEREMRLAGYEVINHVFSFSAEDSAKGIAIQSANGWISQKKASAAGVSSRRSAGFPGLKLAGEKGRRTMAVRGYPNLKTAASVQSLKKGRETMAAGGWENLKKAREAWKLQRTLKTGNGTAGVSQDGGKSLATAQDATVIP